MRNASAIVFSTVLLAVGVLFTGLAMTFEPGTRVAPVGIAALLCLLVALQLVRDLRSARTTPAAESAELADSAGTAADPARAAGATIRPQAAADHESAALGWLLLLAMLLALIGMLAGPALFVVLYLRRRGGEAWPSAVAGGAVAVALVWLVMTQAISAPIPGGWAGSLLAAAFGGSG